MISSLLLVCLAPISASSRELPLLLARKLAEQLALVQNLRPEGQSKEAQAALWIRAGLNPMYKVSGAITGEPSFTRLFSHSDWHSYTGGSPLRRWWRAIATWRYSTVLRAAGPISLIAALWAYFIGSLPSVLLPRTSPIPMSLFGQALGLLLVFRTTNAYQRLAEARALWGKAVFLTREVAQNVATALEFDDNLQRKGSARDAAAATCRYLAAFSWELNAKLTGPTMPDDVLRALLPPAEADWLAAQRSRPLQLLACLRRVMHGQFKAGNLPAHIHKKIEEDLRELDLVVGGCERLFSSPVPPTMSRHVLRCLVLWLLGLPLVLAGSMSAVAVCGWVFITAYIFVGIEEVGMQVEQPFEIVPMTQLCRIIMANLEEAFLQPPPELRG